MDSSPNQNDYIYITTRGYSNLTEETVLLTNGCGVLSQRPFPTQGGEVCAWVVMDSDTVDKVS